MRCNLLKRWCASSWDTLSIIPNGKKPLNGTEGTDKFSSYRESESGKKRLVCEKKDHTKFNDTWDTNGTLSGLHSH